MAQGPLANLVGLNVVGLRRRGFAKADIHRLRMAYKDLFLGGGVFRDRLARVERAYAGVPLIDSVFAFIRGGKRPLSTAIRRGSDDATQDQ
jgi:UDP-N-acetylglucosamine acyltransferase